MKRSSEATAGAPSLPIKQAATEQFLNTLKSHQDWTDVRRVCKVLTDAGFDAVLAGGSVRDGLLGRPPKDFDIATSATPDQVEALFERTVSVGKSFGVIVVPLSSGNTIEVATFRRDGSYQDGRRPSSVEFADRAADAERRDFTVNALFFDPVSGFIFDHVGGFDDLKNRALRVVGDPALRFSEDRLRLLRAIRFSSQLQFEIEEGTAAAIRSAGEKLSEVSRERIRDEIDKMLVAQEPARGFVELDRLNMAAAVFLDWSPMILPVKLQLTAVDDLDVRRALLFFPALKSVSADRVQERLRLWKYGRSFVELCLWMMKNEAFLRTQSKDPSSHFISRALLIQKFQFSSKPPLTGESLESRHYSDEERRWMTSLELWTDERAVKACEVLDAVYGPDPRRDEALKKRSIQIGKPDPWKANAQVLIEKSKKESLRRLEGPDLGRELKRLNREILLRQ